MNFRDCIISARQQGVLSEEEAEGLIRRYEEHRRAHRGTDVPGGPEAAARDALAAEMAAEAARKRRIVALTEAKRAELVDYLTEWKNIGGRSDVFEAVLNKIENYGGGADTSSMAGRAKAITSLIHGELSDLLFAFRRSRLLGKRMNKPMADDIVRELHGEATGKVEAQGFAQSVARVFEDLRERFNAAGGDIAKLEGYALPQHHDARAVLKAGREAWKEYITPRLDPEKMRDPLTGGPISPERLGGALDAAFDNITTDGWATRKPAAQPQGRGSLANQRQEHRFLVFKSADDWLDYSRDFGAGDPLKAIFQHINGMSKDIAAMETFGPNPTATIEWLKQVVQTEAAKATTGKPSLYDASAADKAQAGIGYAPWRIDSIYQYVAGRQVVSNAVATGFGDVRNVITSGVLGSASVTAMATDPILDNAARRMSGLPAAKALWGLVKTFSAGTRQEAVRSGVIMDDFLHIMGDEARYAGTLGGGEWSKWLADRTVTLSGLQPMTQARKHVFALDFQAALADNAGSGFDALPPYLRRTMADYGIDAAGWDSIRATPLHGAGFLRPIDVADRALGERYVEMILQQTERAVPSGTARARSFVTGVSPRGTVMGEILESGLQFKSFALSLTTLQWQQIQRESYTGVPRGAAYAASVMIPLTLGGGLALQIKNISAGKDPMPMDPASSEGVKFWLQAFKTGGGLGLYGDFLFDDVNRFGYSLGESLAGPTVSVATDLLRFGIGNVRQAAEKPDKPTRVEREGIRLLQRYTPLLSSHWATRAAYERVLLDQLQWQIDPEAHKNFTEKRRRLWTQNKQEFWWAPGEAEPRRAPDLESALR